MASRSQYRKLSTLPLEAQSAFLELEERLARLEDQGRITAIQKTQYLAKEGDWVRCAPAPGGTLRVLLPKPREQNRRARIRLVIETTGGSTVVAVAGDATINGLETLTFTARGLVEIVSAGNFGWVTENAPGSIGPASTDLATYHVESAVATLPNARVGTDSTEIDVDYTTPGVVSWVLKAASVVLAKLQDLTGLSILGRAANSSGVMAAITASAARQTLTVNDAGTSLAWGDPVEVRERGTDVGDAYALDVVNGPGMTAHASVSSRVAALQFCLAAHRIKTESATGVIDTSDWNNYDAIYFTGSKPEVQNIPQPTDPDGNAYEKVLWLIGSTVVAPLTIRHNTGTGTGRIFCPNLRDSEQFQLSSSMLVYNTVENRWFIVANTSVVAENNNDGTLLIGRSLNFMSAPAGLTWTLAKVAGEIRITPTLANIPLTALANQADDTGLRNISGGPAPPTASSLSSWVDGSSLEYNAVAHAWRIAASAAGDGLTGGGGLPLAVGAGSRINVDANTVGWAGLEGRIGGVDAGDFVGIDFTNTVGNVVFALDTGAGGTFGVVATVVELPLDNLEDISPGEVLGLQIDAGGDAAPVPLTGAEVGEIARWDTTQNAGLADTGTETITLNNNTTHLILTHSGGGAATVNQVDGMAEGQLVWFDHSPGGGTSTTFEHGTGNLQCPGGKDTRFDAADEGGFLYRQGNRVYVFSQSISDGHVSNEKLDDMPAGTTKGRQIDASTGVPVNLTGAEQQENLRRDTVQVETVSGTTDITLGATTTKLVISYGAATTIRGISGADVSGREVLVELFQNTGGTFFCDVLHAAATPGGTNRVFNPNSKDIRYTSRDAFVMSARGDVWRVSNIANDPFFNEPGDADRDILIHDGDEWEKENLTTAVDGAAPGRLISTQVVTSSQTVTPPSGAARCLFELQAAGGGGGGSDDDTDAGGGGGGGAYIRVFVALGGNSPSVTIGAAGSGGAGTSNGSTGTASSVTIGASTWTCNAGAGGQSGQNGSAGGPGGNVSGSFSGRLLSLNGESGRPGVFIDANVNVYGGDGGASYLGHSLPGASSSANGVSGDTGRPGSGGSGAASFGITDRTGGTGAPAVAVFYFYS